MSRVFCKKILAGVRRPIAAVVVVGWMGLFGWLRCASLAMLVNIIWNIFLVERVCHRISLVA